MAALGSDAGPIPTLLYIAMEMGRFANEWERTSGYRPEAVDYWRRCIIDTLEDLQPKRVA